MWTGITISVPTADVEAAVINVLLNAGCAGVALCGENTARAVTSYILEDETTEHKLDQISAALTMLPALGINGAGTAVLSKVNEEDWANSWKAYFKPIRVGRRLIVSPPWESPELTSRELLITIDPGMAFGTGTHATTQLCLTLIEEYLRPGMSVADVGTGSGILAIAASLLGAANVTAVDNDPLAVRIAGQNATVNHTRIHTSSDFPIGDQFQLVAANIVADTIIELSDMLASITESEGVLIVSGIIEDRQDEVRIFLEGSGFTSLETRAQGEWVALVLRRTSI